MALLVLAGGILGYAVYKQMMTEPTYEDIMKANNKGIQIYGYNPYVLNQFVEWKDRIFSADVSENDIYSKPVQRENGIYGITEEHITLNSVDVKTIVNNRENLNL